MSEVVKRVGVSKEEAVKIFGGVDEYMDVIKTLEDAVCSSINDYYEERKGEDDPVMPPTLFTIVIDPENTDEEGRVPTHIVYKTVKASHVFDPEEKRDLIMDGAKLIMNNAENIVAGKPLSDRVKPVSETSRILGTIMICEARVQTKDGMHDAIVITVDTGFSEAMFTYILHFNDVEEFKYVGEKPVASFHNIEDEEDVIYSVQGNVASLFKNGMKAVGAATSMGKKMSKLASGGKDESDDDDDDE